MRLKPLLRLRGLPSSRPVWIYGCGEAGRLTAQALAVVGAPRVAGFVDSVRSGRLEGLEILPLERFLALAPSERASLVIASQAAEEIAANLARCGVGAAWDARPLVERLQCESRIGACAFASSGETTAFYDERYAGSYMDDWDGLKKKILTETLGGLGLSKKARVVDFGCGSGVLTALLQEVLPECEVTGFDPSLAAVERASARFPRICFKPLTPETLAAETGRFDLVFSHHVLEHVFDLEETGRSMAGLLRPNGRMLHILPCGDRGSLERLICVWGGRDPDAETGGRFFFEDAGHLRRLSTADMASLFAPLGFEIAQARYLGRFWGALRWISAASPGFISMLCDPLTRRRGVSENLTRRRRALESLGSALLFLRALRMRTNLVGKALDALTLREWRRAETGSEMIVVLQAKGSSKR